MTQARTGARGRAAIRLIVLAALIAVAAVASLVYPLPSLEEIRRFFSSTGWWGPAAFILAYAFLTLAPVPKNVLSVAAGVVFGFAGGIAVVFAAAMLGAVAAFWLGRDAVESFTCARVERVDGILRRRGLGAVIGVRLVPVLPFTWQIRL